MEAGREIRKIREKGALKSTAGQAALETLDPHEKP
jgi:hypothetical protein